MWRKVVSILAVLIRLAVVAAAAPGAGGASYTAAYHYLTCQVSAIVQPTSTKQLAAIVKGYAAQSARGAPVRVRASRPKFHSSAAFPCPAMSGTTPPLVLASARVAQAITVAVHHNKLDKVLSVDRKRYTMRVGAGMDLNKLLAAATAAGMSVQVGSVPVYAGLTLAGILSTSAHGTGDRAVQNLEDTVLSVTFVDGKGNIVTRARTHPDFRAVSGGLGLMGVITELTLQLTPASNMQLTTWFNKPDKDLGQQIPEMLKVSPHVLIFWRPDLARYTAFITKTAPQGSKANPRAQTTLMPDVKQKYEGLPLRPVLKQQQSIIADDPPALGLLCPGMKEHSLADFTWATIGKEPAYNVTGLTNRMTSSECDSHCLWNDETFAYGTAQDVEFTFEHSQLSNWIADVKKIFKEDLYENGKYSYRCMGIGYLWIRFGRGSSSYLATNSGLKRPVYVQSTWMRSRDVPQFPIRYQFVLDLIEELTLCKYNGRPHWGKNFDRTFTHPRCPVRPKYPGFKDFLAAQQRYDPLKMYESALFKKVVAQQPYSYSPRCTLNQSCFCKEDIHCPAKFKCVPAKSFPAYKVCKYLGPPAPGTFDFSFLGR